MNYQRILVFRVFSKPQPKSQESHSNDQEVLPEPLSQMPLFSLVFKADEESLGNRWAPKGSEKKLQCRPELSWCYLGRRALFSFGCFGDVVHRCHHAVLVQGRPANHGCVRRASSLKCLCISVLHHDINKTVFDVFGVLGLCRLRWRHGRPIALVHMCVLAFMCDLDNVYVSESAAR